MITDGWYKVRHKDETELDPAVLRVVKGKHAAGGVSVSLNMELGFTYEKVFVITEAQLRALVGG